MQKMKKEEEDQKEEGKKEASKQGGREGRQAGRQALSILIWDNAQDPLLSKKKKKKLR